MQTVRLSEDERAMLEAMAEHEERNIGDVIRRALRAYAVQLGVAPKREPATPRKARSKTALPQKGGRPGILPPSRSVPRNTVPSRTRTTRNP